MAQTTIISERKARRLLVNLGCSRFIFCPLSYFSRFRQAHGVGDKRFAYRRYIRSDRTKE